MFACKKCKESKPANYFYTANTKRGVTATCKACKNERHKEIRNSESRRWIMMKNIYNVGKEWYYKTLEEQGGGCGICSIKPKEGKYLHIDHCHKTGQVRGLLCANCNVALGHFKDDLNAINRAIKYLEGGLC